MAQTPQAGVRHGRPKGWGGRSPIRRIVVEIPNTDFCMTAIGAIALPIILAVMGIVVSIKPPPKDGY
jgi:hypothetical protein